MNYLHQQNTKLIVFDLDGTIADTSGGILDAHKYTLSTMGRQVPTDRELYKLIGGNLLEIYINCFGFTDDGAREAVKIYRERYAVKGIHMASLYTGVADMLKELRKRGYLVGMATLKAEKFANIILSENSILKYFNAVCGMDLDDSLNKAELVRRCVYLCNSTEEKTILIGDSESDRKGAERADVRFLGVTYGYGFGEGINYEFETVNSVNELKRKIIW